MRPRLGPLGRASFLLAAMVMAAVTAGCGTRAVGSVRDGSVGDASVHRDVGVPRDAEVPYDAGQAEVWGTVVYQDERRETGGPGMSALLKAAFFGVDYPLPEAGPADFVETRVTFDNVECDIYFTSPRWGRPPSPLPPEPEQLDVGEVRLESAFDSEEAFAISWAGNGYTVDERPGANAPLPSWVVPEGLETLVVFMGSSRLPAGSHRASFGATPTLVEPVDGGEVQPDVNGLFRIAWEAPAGMSVVVRMDMNMDWDNATFMCRPPSGHDEILLPQSWMNDYSWGYAELRIIGRRDERFPLGTLDLRLRVRRTTYRSVQFAIVW